MIWISYYIAIKKSPGQAPKNYTPKPNEWKRWCKKCEAYKPPRAHHCKTCKKCVLKMDHHCPWTSNCVGYNNMPHFMRFLFWVNFTTGFTFVELFKRGLEFWDQRNLPAYMFDKEELWVLIVLILLDGFVFMSVGLLTIKCLIHIVSGLSQIETWEWERIEYQMRSERFWKKIRKNYSDFHGKPMPKLSSIRAEQYFYYKNSEAAKKSDHFLYSIDDVVFPYDLGFIGNVFNQLNYPWMWLVPWAGPLGDGINYEMSSLLDEDQLGLPWPPDGGHAENEETVFVNPAGEKLEDYGVDTEI